MRIDRIFSNLYDAKLFSVFDVRSRYYYITVAEDIRKYMDFSTEYSKYEFLQIPFVIHVASSYFSMMINEILKD